MTKLSIFGLFSWFVSIVLLLFHIIASIMETDNGIYENLSLNDVIDDRTYFWFDQMFNGQNRELFEAVIKTPMLFHFFILGIMAFCINGIIFRNPG